MVPRGGVEPPTLRFSVGAPACDIKGLAGDDLQNRPRSVHECKTGRRPQGVCITHAPSAPAQIAPLSAIPPGGPECARTCWRLSGRQMAATGGRFGGDRFFAGELVQELHRFDMMVGLRRLVGSVLIWVSKTESDSFPRRKRDAVICELGLRAVFQGPHVDRGARQQSNGYPHWIGGDHFSFADTVDEFLSYRHGRLPYLDFRSATIAARTASSGDLMPPRCSTA